MGLPRSGNAEQGLRLHACIEARCELRYGPRLVACWLIFAVYPESVPRRILHTETSGSFLVVKRRASGTYDPIILRTRAFSRSFRRRYHDSTGLRTTRREFLRARDMSYGRASYVSTPTARMRFLSNGLGRKRHKDR